MSHRSLVRFALFSALLLVSTPAAGQGDSTTAPRTSRSAIFSEPQATRGKDVFLGRCQSCHTAASMASPDFVSNWNGKDLAELFTYLVENMPEDEPGSMSRAQYADVMAYVLQLNNMPAGEKELPFEVDSLKGIRIDVAPSASALGRLRAGSTPIWRGPVEATGPGRTERRRRNVPTARK